MKTFLECFPCMMSQALRAGRMASDNEFLIKKVLDEVGAMIKDIPMENTPAESGALVYKKISDITGVIDPYKEIKQQSIKEAKSLYHEMKKEISKSKDSLLTAIRIAIAGNVVDFGMNKKFSLSEDVKHILVQNFAILDYKEFQYQLKNAQNILYLGDNAGESVFDKILIEELGKKVTYVVREIPIINDVTYKDAIDSGLNTVAEIISSGTTAPGTILQLCSDDFLQRFNQADMIISKGQGNYEGLSGVDRGIFFLLKAKCPVIARDINVQENDIVLQYKKPI
ncbi:MAG: ARMT1-like domain-containing protein [Bacteroidales bacterium]|nr:ARMT1-like domain-containing protein [Bacteroidales bacterium]